MPASASSTSAPASASASVPAHPAVGSRPAGEETSRSLVYGLELLRQFTARQPERGITELARELNVSRSTAHRYAATCLELGYLEQSATRRYRLTRRCAQPGMAALEAFAPMRAARPILRELRAQTGRTVSLAVLDGADVLYLQRLCGFQRGQYRLERALGLGAGSRRPAQDTAAGRALLAAVGEVEVRGERPPRVHEAVHERGLTVDDGALPGPARGLALAISAPAPGASTSAIEITVPAESLRAAELLATLGEPLRQAGAALGAALQAAPLGASTEPARECVTSAGPQGDEGQAGQGRRERGVLCTRATEDAEMRRPSSS